MGSDSLPGPWGLTYKPEAWTGPLQFALPDGGNWGQARRGHSVPKHPPPRDSGCPGGSGLTLSVSPPQILPFVKGPP